MQIGGWRLIRSLVLAVLTLSGVASCGGDGGSCAMVTNCGGNPVGNWKITSSCISEKGALDESATCTATVNSTASITGTASFNADLSYSVSWLLSGNETVDYPASCLTSGTQTVTCDDLTQIIMNGSTSPTIAGNCVAASGGCHCTLTFSQFPDVETGTYATAGGTLTVNSATGTSEPNGYCVRGDRLDLTPPPMMMPTTTSGATLSSTGNLTFARQ